MILTCAFDASVERDTGAAIETVVVSAGGHRGRASVVHGGGQLAGGRTIERWCCLFLITQRIWM